MSSRMTDDKHRAMRIENSYIQYLQNIIGIKHNNKTYRRLINILYDTEFYYYVENDGNRAAAGISWRDEFAKDYAGGDTEEAQIIANDILGGPCSFLELLIGLAEAMNGFFIGEKFSSISYWFWVLISNVGLDKFSDDVIDPNFVDKIKNILTRVMDRNYEEDGKGGLFPLKTYNGYDQTEIELWYQMSEYIQENYNC